MKRITLIAAAIALLAGFNACTQSTKTANEPQTDSNTPLHLLQPDYIIPYGVPAVADIKADLDRVLAFEDV